MVRSLLSCGIAAALFTLVGCGGGEPAPAPEPTPEAAPAPTPEPTPEAPPPFTADPGVVAAYGTVTDAAAAQHCCQFANGCVSGPADGSAACTAAGGTHVANASCVEMKCVVAGAAEGAAPAAPAEGAAPAAPAAQ
jgi:hypothetical protein